MLLQPGPDVSLCVPFHAYTRKCQTASYLALRKIRIEISLFHRSPHAYFLATFRHINLIPLLLFHVGFSGLTLASLLSPTLHIPSRPLAFMLRSSTCPHPHFPTHPPLHASACIPNVHSSQLDPPSPSKFTLCAGSTHTLQPSAPCVRRSNAPHNTPHSPPLSQTPTRAPLQLKAACLLHRLGIPGHA